MPVRSGHRCPPNLPPLTSPSTRSTSVSASSFRASEVSASFVTVTLPFHPLSGERLRVLGQERSPRGLELDCDGGPLGRVRLPAVWTDRVPQEAAGRVSAGILAELGAVMSVIAARRAG